MVLPDLLAEHLDLVLCGTAPSLASMRAQAYYAHPGNIFWQTLFAAGLTPTVLQPKNYAELLRSHIGLTDLNKTESGADSMLSAGAFDIADFAAKMLRYRPRMIGFTSKFAASKFLHGSAIPYGLQIETFEQIKLFVLPSTSGRARRYFEIVHWHKLAQEVGTAKVGCVSFANPSLTPSRRP